MLIALDLILMTGAYVLGCLCAYRLAYDWVYYAAH